MEHRNVRVYLDDIPAFSRTQEEHIETLKMILQLLREEQLFAKAKKCEFLLPEIDLLGVKVSAQGFRMEEKKNYRNTRMESTAKCKRGKRIPRIYELLQTIHRKVCTYCATAQ